MPAFALIGLRYSFFFDGIIETIVTTAPTTVTTIPSMVRRTTGSSHRNPGLADPFATIGISGTKESVTFPEETDNPPLKSVYPSRTSRRVCGPEEISLRLRGVVPRYDPSMYTFAPTGDEPIVTSPEEGVVVRAGAGVDRTAGVAWGVGLLSLFARRVDPEKADEWSLFTAEYADTGGRTNAMRRAQITTGTTILLIESPVISAVPGEGFPVPPMKSGRGPFPNLYFSSTSFFRILIGLLIVQVYFR